jgi:hypothetical protein
LPFTSIAPGCPLIHTFRKSIIALLGCSVFSPPLLGAQDADRPERYDDIAVVAGNAAIGSLTVVAGSLLRGKKPSARKVAQGALGGATVFAGKAIVTEDRWYAAIVGRQLASIGSSAIQNVASGRGFADRLLLPWGPLRFHVDRTERLRMRAKLDVAGVAMSVAGIMNDDLELDVDKSLQYGLIVLRNDGRKGNVTAVGSHMGGVIKYRTLTAWSADASDESIDAIIAHELVHVNAWGNPVESYALGKFRLGRAINRYVDLGIHVPIAAGLNGVVEYRSRPWEREAVSLVATPQGQ